MILEQAMKITDEFMTKYAHLFTDGLKIKVEFYAGDSDSHAITLNQYTIRKPRIVIYHETIDSASQLRSSLLHELLHIRTAEFDILTHSFDSFTKKVFDTIIERGIAGITETIISLIPEIIQDHQEEQCQ